MSVHHGGRGPGHVSRWSKAATSTPTPTPAYAMLFFGDSNSRGTYTKVSPTDDDIGAPVEQYIEGSRGYPQSAGFTTDLSPIENYETFVAAGSVSLLSTLEYGMRSLYAATSAPICVFGSGIGGASLTNTGHVLGALPDAATAFAKDKIEDGLAAWQLANPNYSIEPVILTTDTSNDLNANLPATPVYTAKKQQLADLRTATGWSNAPMVCISSIAEEVGIKDFRVDRAHEQAALESGALYCRIPTGYNGVPDFLHPGPIAAVRTIGTDLVGPLVKIALGLVAGTASTPAIHTGRTVVEGTTDPMVLRFSDGSPGYWTIDPATSDGSGALSPSLFTIEHRDVPEPELRPASTWQAYDAGTPANNTIRVKLNYVNNHQIAGTITTSVVIVAAATYVFKADFQSADSTTLGNADTGQPWTNSDTTDCRIRDKMLTFSNRNTSDFCWADTSTQDIDISFLFSMPRGSNGLFQYRFRWDNTGEASIRLQNGLLRYHNGATLSNIGSGTYTALSEGRTYGIRLRIVGTTVTLYIDYMDGTGWTQVLTGTNAAINTTNYRFLTINQANGDVRTRFLRAVAA